jgi:hypothetical protein
MKMLMVIYSGADPRHVTSSLDGHGAGGYTQFQGVHGVGATGRREGSRVWPGESTLFVSVLPDEDASGLVGALRAQAATLPDGERMHVAVIATENFF